MSKQFFYIVLVSFFSATLSAACGAETSSSAKTPSEQSSGNDKPTTISDGKGFVAISESDYNSLETPDRNPLTIKKEDFVVVRRGLDTKTDQYQYNVYRKEYWRRIVAMKKLALKALDADHILIDCLRPNSKMAPITRRQPCLSHVDRKSGRTHVFAYEFFRHGYTLDDATIADENFIAFAKDLRQKKFSSYEEWRQSE